MIESATTPWVLRLVSATEAVIGGSDAAASSRAQEQAQVALPAACHCRLALDQPYL
ncbi:hypothetical protein RIB2604_01706680 [Aspergillus luchuensis]|uniref:Uncharacterized protein n=1 Tax=Aspergillus kawachii TaxID=1069201 RepID=A0A146FD22_ASPKA|nr:hypothetical protein RIB2604_01706680 [Aspergillus luchuensis]